MVIIKATRLQAWAPAGGGGGKSRPSPPYLENKKKYFGYIGGLFATFFSFLGSFSPCGGDRHTCHTKISMTQGLTANSS